MDGEEDWEREWDGMERRRRGAGIMEIRTFRNVWRFFAWRSRCMGEKDDRFAVVRGARLSSAGQRDAFCREITRRGRRLGRVGGTGDKR